MDYEKLYFRLVQYCQTVPARERIARRNPNDPRIKGQIFYERHHIVPLNDGGKDAEDNLVTVLIEEHYILHLIRWKAYKKRGDFLAVRAISNGINKSHYRSSYKNLHSTYVFKLSRWKKYIPEFRKLHSWHTKDGAERIGKAQKGVMSVKDAVTGKFIGRVPTNHPKVESGEWVHHTTGMITVTDRETGRKIRIRSEDYDKARYFVDGKSGKENGNFKEYNEDFFKVVFEEVSKTADAEGYIRQRYAIKVISELSRAYFKNPVSTPYINKCFGTFANFVVECAKATGKDLKYNPYLRNRKRLRLMGKPLQPLQKDFLNFFN